DYATLRNGAINLPIVGTKGAPKRFKGKAEDVVPFLQHYTRLCAKHGVTDAREKLENITHYCTRHVKEFLEGLDSYRNNDWTTFLKDFKKYYNADKDERRFRVQDLERYVALSRSQTAMKTLDQWRKYDRGFIRIGGWLLEKRKITSDEHATYFWKGIPRKFRDRLENCLMGQHSTHDISKLFSIDKIERVAKALLQRNRFDKELMPSEDEIESDSDIFTDSDSSDSSDSESSEDEKYRKSSKKSKNARKKKSKKSFRYKTSDSSSDEDSDEDIPATRKSKDSKKVRFCKKGSKADEDVEEMIEQLNKMSIDDPSYGTLYYRACLANPLVRDIVPSPVTGRRRSGSMTRHSQDFEREPPPHFQRGRLTYSSGSRCYGCGGSGHIMEFCPKIKDLLDKGIVKRDDAGRYVMQNSSRIWRRGPDEPLATAAMKQVPRQANMAEAEEDMDMYWGELDEETFNEFYLIETPTAHYIYASQVETDEDEEAFNKAYPCLLVDSPYLMEAVKSSNDKEEYIYAVDRPVRSTRTARKDQFSGVWPPERRAEAKKADKAKAEKKLVPTPIKESTSSKPTVKPTSYQKLGPRFVDQKPYEPRRPAFDADDSDILMEDELASDEPSSKAKKRKDKEKPLKSGQGRAIEPASKPKIVSQLKKMETDREGPDRRQPRSLDLQAKTDTNEVMKKILHAPVTLPVGEILGSSKELLHQLQEILKPRSASRNVALQIEDDELDVDNFLGTLLGVYAASTAPRSRGTLIKLVLEINDVPIKAIIDTGSQLNIASLKTWQRLRTRPKDVTKNIRMNDANGGQGILSEFVSNVPLRCGEVITHANIFIGEKAPFDLLLGRP
ncbi:hypothetical protein EIP86_000770, partial [Pleurotus ostreatoroseus]